jgi:uncharacterized RmlC-like cupin family protein
MGDNGIVTIRPAGRSSGRQGLEYAWGISAESVGARGICAHLVRIPPGGRARAHLHAGHETAIYMLAGTAVTWFGDGLRERVVNTVGDLIYIPPGCPHLPVNPSASEEAVALVARTDPSEQESVVLLPELDGLPHTYAADPSVA